jgi:hypothetical protein
MTTLVISLIVIVIFLAIALFISQCESTGGLCGSYSLVPGILIAMVLVLAIVVLIGFGTGNIAINFK